MASQQVELQRADVRVRDGDVRKLPETRLDAVRERALRDDLLEGATARVDALCGGRGEPHELPFAGDGDHVIEVEGPAVDRTHGDRRGIPVPRYSSGAHLLRTNLKGPPVLKRSRRAEETRRRSRSGTAMELRSLRGRGLDGFDSGSRRRGSYSRRQVRVKVSLANARCRPNQGWCGVLPGSDSNPLKARFVFPASSRAFRARPTRGPFKGTWEGPRSTSIFRRTRSSNCASRSSRGFPSDAHRSSSPESGSAVSKGLGRRPTGTRPQRR